jgi:hypothetical protein
VKPGPVEPFQELHGRLHQVRREISRVGQLHCRAVGVKRLRC